MKVGSIAVIFWALKLSHYLFIGILRILLRDEVLADTVDLKSLAKRTELFSGSDLKRKPLFKLILNGS